MGHSYRNIELVRLILRTFPILVLVLLDFGGESRARSEGAQEDSIGARNMKMRRTSQEYRNKTVKSTSKLSD